MTIYSCSLCSGVHRNTDPPCPVTYVFDLNAAQLVPVRPKPLRVCSNDGCAETLRDDGSCQICSQMVMHERFDGTKAPLTIRAPPRRMKSENIRFAHSASKRRWDAGVRCAVVAADTPRRNPFNPKYPFTRDVHYLTACGKLVRADFVARSDKQPTCPACKSALRRAAGQSR